MFTIDSLILKLGRIESHALALEPTSITTEFIHLGNLK